MSDSDDTWYAKTLGCTEQPTPKVFERIKSDGRANVVRSRGQMKALLDGSAAAAAPSEPPPPSELSFAGFSQPNLAKAVAVKNRGTVGQWLNVEGNLQSGYQSARPAPHCPTPVAQEMLQKAAGSMAGYIGSESEYPAPANAHKLHPRAVKREAERFASPHKGSRMEALLYDPMSIPVAPPAPSRCVKPEAEDIASKHTGAPMARLLGEYGRLPLSDRHPRVTTQGEPYAELQKGQRIKQLINEQQQRPWPAAAASGSGGGATPIERGSNNESYDRRNKTTFTMAWT